MRQPRLVIMTQICTATDPHAPNDSATIPAYVMDLPDCVYLNKNSTVTSVINATAKMERNPGSMPKTLIVAGTDMIPAPIMVVEMLNTAPEIDAASSACDEFCFSKDAASCRSGVVSILASF